MGYSDLVNSIVLTDNCSSRGSFITDTITPHYMCWYTDGETCAESFVPASRRASANYCIGKYGDIVLNVDEDYRAWTSGYWGNDQRAITIECANYVEDDDYGHVEGQLPDATWQSLVALCADICVRLGYEGLYYCGSADYDSLPDGYMLLTMHKWFDSTDCPGPWLSYQFERLANEVNAVIGSGSYYPEPKNNTHGGKLDVDGNGGYNTVLDMQHALGTPEDGIISGQSPDCEEYLWAMIAVTWSGEGSQMVEALQRKIGAHVDGTWGPETSKKLQEYLINKGYSCGSCGADGFFGHDSVRALQQCLNDGNF